MVGDSYLENRELLIAAVAASVAGGCIKCLEYHKKSALAAGLTESELLEIATLAFKIRDKADEFNRADLDSVLISTGPVSTEDFSCCGSPREKNKCE